MVDKGGEGKGKGKTTILSAALGLLTLKTHRAISRRWTDGNGSTRCSTKSGG